MNNNMRDFAHNVEEKLNRAYKEGNYMKRFGFEGMNTNKMEEEYDKAAQMGGPGK